MEQHQKPWVFSALPLILFSHAVAAIGTPTCSQLGGAYTSSSHMYSTQCDTITVGQNFVAAYQQGDTFTQCIDRCDGNDDCIAVIYESSSGDCGLVDSYTATVSYTGYDFAAKGQTVVTTSSVAPATSSEEAQTTTSSEEVQTTTSSEEVQTTTSSEEAQTTSSAAISTSESTLEPTVPTTTSATTSAEFTTFSTVLSLSTSGTTSVGTLEPTLETTSIPTSSTSASQPASQTTTTLTEESSTSQYTTATSTTYRGCRPRRSLSPSIRK